MVISNPILYGISEDLCGAQNLLTEIYTFLRTSKEKFKVKSVADTNCDMFLLEAPRSSILYIDCQTESDSRIENTRIVLVN
jgi:hypothetical protein